MKVNRLHGFDITLARAKELQIELVERIIVGGGPAEEDIHIVAGCDCAFDKARGLIFGAVVLMSFPELETISVVAGSAPIRFPYIPGFLSFREMEVLIELFERVDNAPNLLLIDGQGIAHPRGIGLASHLGLFLEIPTIGCAKSRLVGECVEPGPDRGDWTPIKYKGGQIGSLLRTRKGVKPMFISPGHLVGLKKSRELALVCTGKFRLPEPTRNADIAVAKYKKEMCHVQQ